MWAQCDHQEIWGILSLLSAYKATVKFWTWRAYLWPSPIPLKGRQGCPESQLCPHWPLLVIFAEGHRMPPFILADKEP